MVVVMILMTSEWSENDDERLRQSSIQDDRFESNNDRAFQGR